MHLPNALKFNHRKQPEKLIYSQTIFHQQWMILTPKLRVFVRILKRVRVFSETARAQREQVEETTRTL